MTTDSRQDGGRAGTATRPTVNGSFPTTPCEATLARLPIPFPRAYRLLDGDLAALLGVEGRVLRQTLRRHLSCFTIDLVFPLTNRHLRAFREQSARPPGWGGARRRPWAFSQPGAIAMAARLQSPVAQRVHAWAVRFACAPHGNEEPFRLFFAAVHTAWALGAAHGEWDASLLAPGRVIPQPAWMRRYLDQLLDELADDDLGEDSGEAENRGTDGEVVP